MTERTYTLRTDLRCPCGGSITTLDRNLSGDPDEIRLGRRIDDVDAGDLT